MKENIEILLQEKLAPAFFAGAAIAFLIYLFTLNISVIVLFASLGSTAFLLAAFPDTRQAKLRVVISAYIICIICGYIASYIPMQYLASGVAVFAAAFLMLVSDNAHIPAAGSALAFSLQTKDLAEMGFVLLAMLLLLVFIKVIVYVYKKELHLRKFHHELKRM